MGSFRCAFKRKRRFSVRALFRYDQNFVRSFKMNPNIKLSKLFGNSSIKSIAILILMILPAFKCDTQNDYQYHHQPRSQRRSFLERVLPGLRLPRLGNTPTLDPDTVYNGVFDPSKISSILRCQLWVGFWLRLRIARARNEATAEVSP